MQCAFPRSLDSNQKNEPTNRPFDHDTETDSVTLRGFDLVYVKIG